MSIRKSIYPMAFVPEEKHVNAQVAENLDGKSIRIGKQKTILHYVGDCTLISEIMGKGDKRRFYCVKFKIGTIPPESDPLIFCQCSVYPWEPWGEAGYQEVSRVESAGEQASQGEAAGEAKQAGIVNTGERASQAEAAGEVKQAGIVNTGEQASQGEAAGEAKQAGIVIPAVEGLEPEDAEKKDIYDGIKKHLIGRAREIGELKRIERPKKTVLQDKTAENDARWNLNEEQRIKLAQKLRTCTERNKICFEIYAAEQTDPVAQRIAERYRSIFQSTEDMTFEIRVRKLAKFCNPLDQEGDAGIQKRIREIERVTTDAEDLTACVILLPEWTSHLREETNLATKRDEVIKTNLATKRDEVIKTDLMIKRDEVIKTDLMIKRDEVIKTDPATKRDEVQKTGAEEVAALIKAVRMGFAFRRRLTHFIEPWMVQGNNVDAVIDASVDDLCCQMGYVREMEEVRRYLEDGMDFVPVVGIHVMSQVKTANGVAEYLPVFVGMNFISGRIYVECNAFGCGRVPYHEAAFEMARLSRDEDILQKCKTAARDMLRQKILIWSELYRGDKFLAVIDGDEAARTLYYGISDEMLQKYEYVDPYRPAQFEIGVAENKREANLERSGIRFLRIRRPDELPDYHANPTDKEGYSASSGIFQFEKVYWTIPPVHKAHPIPRRHDLLEIYPLMVQRGDYPEKWVSYVNSLRFGENLKGNELSIPLPIYLAQRLREYLLEITE